MDWAMAWAVAVRACTNTNNDKQMPFVRAQPEVTGYKPPWVRTVETRRLGISMTLKKHAKIHEL